MIFWVKSNNFEVTTNFSQYQIAGDILRVTLVHPVNQDVTGTPRIGVQIGASNLFANYVSGNGTKSLIFEYTVQPGDEDSDGIDLSTVVDLNGGTLTFQTLSGTVNSHTTLPSVDTSEVYVDTTAPTITAALPPVDGTYALNDSLQYIVNFSENVKVQGAPTFSINIGGSLQSASFTSGNLTSSLLFQKTVIATDIDADGVEGLTPLELNGGSITDLAGNTASISFVPTTVTPPLSNVIVNGSLTVVADVTPPIDNTYLTGANLDIVVEFTDTVTVTGSPFIVTEA